MIAAIAAGGRVSSDLADVIGTDIKALAPFDGRTLLDVALAAAAQAGASRIVVVGPRAVRARCGTHADEVIDESPSGRENLARALGAAEANRPLLFLASDLPFVTGGDVAAFVARANRSDVALPLARATAYEERFPGAAPHATRVGGERIVNGSVAYFGPGGAPRALAATLDLFDARKSLWRMAALLGPQLLVRFATGTLRIAHIERRARVRFELEARAVRDAPPGLCYDVDTLADYRYALAATR